MRRSLLLPFLVAATLGAALGIVAKTSAWSNTAILGVGLALVALLVLVGTPLAFRPVRRAKARARSTTRETGHRVSGDLVIEPVEGMTVAFAVRQATAVVYVDDGSLPSWDWVDPESPYGTRARAALR